MTTRSKKKKSISEISHYCIVCDTDSGELEAYIEEDIAYVDDYTRVLFTLPIIYKRKKREDIRLAPVYLD